MRNCYGDQSETTCISDPLNVQKEGDLKTLSFVERKTVNSSIF